MKHARLLRTIAATVLLLGACGCAMSKGNDPGEYFEDQYVIALCKAVMAGDLARIDQLVESGADVNARGRDGMTPLLFSMVGFNKSGLKHLMELGANPNFQTANKGSYMSYAARANDSDYLRMGLAHGGDPNLRGRMEWTLLFEAAMENNDGVLENLQLLLDHGAEINAISKGISENAAMAAAGINQYEPALYLLEQGIDYQRQNKVGSTITRPLEANGIGYNPGYGGYDARTRVAQFLIDRSVEVQLKRPYEAPDDWLEASFRAIGKPVPQHLK